MNEGNFIVACAVFLIVHWDSY